MPDLTTDEGVASALREVARWGDPGVVPAPTEQAVTLRTGGGPSRSGLPRVLVAAAVLAVLIAGAVAIGSRRSQPSASALAGGEWSTMAPSPLSPRHSPTMLWTGDEVLVLGGYSDNGREPPYTDGARYDPVTDTWRPMEPLPSDGGRVVQLAAWTGSEAVYVVHHMRLRMVTDDYDVVAYDPQADTWRTLLEARFDPDPPTDALVPLGPVPIEAPEALVMAGDELVVVGWQSSASEYAWATIDRQSGSTTGRYPLPGDGDDLYFIEKTTVVVGDQVLFGRADFHPGQLSPWGFLIDPGDASVVTLPEPSTDVDDLPASTIKVQGGVIGGRAVLVGVATNDEGQSQRVAWALDGRGRWESREALPDGPTSDQYQSISLVPTPHGLVVLGGHALGEGNTSGGLTSRGALRVYSNEDDDGWSELPEAPIDLQRIGAATVWTGREVVIWGGTSATAGPFRDGARYEVPR